MMFEPHAHPIAEYAKTIYLVWDKDKREPPKGFDSWMAFWQFKYGDKVQPTRVEEDGRIARV